ncbi:MAG: OmpA family protein [Chitinophagaceae bacterium]
MKQLLEFSYRKLFLIAAVLMVIAGNAQTTADYLKAADEYYVKGDYYSAAMYYERFLAGKPPVNKNGFNPYVINQVSSKTTAATPSTRKEIVYKLADSYRMIKYYSKAEPLYLESIPQVAEYPLAGYWYAKSLKANDKGAEAETAFNDFLKGYTTEDDYTRDAKKELDNIQFATNELKKKDLYKFKVNKMDGTVNQTGASYASTFLTDGSVVFTTTRADTGMAIAFNRNPYTNKLIQASAESKAFTNQMKVELPTDAGWEQGVASFSPNGNKVFVTRWATVGGKKISALYQADKNATAGWSAPIKLGENVNVTGASTQQPFVTTDGKLLLFSSNRADGLGKFDLWSVALDASSNPIGAATNLGSTINTADDDEAPFYHQPSQTLIYATNGRMGMGGLDLFYTKGNFITWESPKNMGYPVNSVKDDIYYNTNDPKNPWNNAYLSSDRNSPCCLELFTFSKIRNKKVVSGRVLDCDNNTPITGAIVSAKDINGRTVFTKTTDANGKYEMVMDDYQDLGLNATGQGYNGKSLNFNSPNDANDDIDAVRNPDLCLTKPPVIVDTPIAVNVPVVLDNVLYEFNKYALAQASYPALDKLVKLMEDNPGMAIELSSHTDNIGADKYNQVLSEKRAASCVQYMVSKGIDKSRIETKGYGESMPVAPNTIKGKDNPAGRQRNRRTEFKILHY